MSIHQQFEALAAFSKNKRVHIIEQEFERLKARGAFTLSAGTQDISGVTRLPLDNGQVSSIYPLRPIGFGKRLVRQAPRRDAITYLAPTAAGVLAIMAVADTIRHQSLGSGLLIVPMIVLTALLAKGLKNPKNTPNMVGVEISDNAALPLRVVEYYDPARDKRVAKRALPKPSVAG